MADTTNPWHVGTQGNAGRAIATLSIAIPITLSGKDANGVEFTEKTKTIVVDKFGGKVATKNALSLGSELTLQNLIVGQTTQIKVVWVGERRAAGEPSEVGIQLLGSQNIWGIDFPSYDRQGGGPASSRLKLQGPRKPVEAAPSPELPTAPKFAAPDTSSSLTPAEAGRPGPSLAPPTMETPSLSPQPVAVETAPLPVEESKDLIKATLARFSQQIEAADENKARLFQKKPEESTRPLSLLTQTHVQEIAKEFEARESSLKERMKTLEGDLLAYRAEMQQLVAELGELKHAVQDEMGKTLREVQENRPKMVELALGDMSQKVREEIGTVAEEAVGLAQQRLQEEAAAASETVIQGALERVHSAVEEQSASAGEGFQSRLRRLIEEGQEQLGHTLQSTTSKFGEEINRISATAIASAQTEIASAWSKSAPGMEAQLQKTADEVAESAAQQLQKQLEDTLLLLSEELKSSAKNVTAETEDRLSNAGRSALEAVSSASDYALEEFQVRLGERAETTANNYMMRLEESLAKAEGEQQKSALSNFRKALEQECAEALARMNDGLAQVLQAVGEQADRQAGALNDLRKAVEEESLQTLANLKGAATETLAETSAQVERMVSGLKDLREAVQEESAKTLAKAKSDANQAIRGLAEQVERDMEALNDLRNALMDESAQALPKFQEDLERVMGEVSEQVQQQVNMLCSLQSLIEKESTQIFSKAKNDVAEAVAAYSHLVEQQMNSTRTALDEWEAHMASRVESQIQQVEGSARASLETLQAQSALVEERMKSAQASLSEWEAQMGSRVELQLQQFEGSARTSLEALREQSAEMLKSRLDQLRGETRALTGLLGATLKQTADNIEQEWTEKIQGRQQQLAEQIIEASAAQLGKQLGENLNLFGEQLKLKQEQAASAAAEVFRSKMAEMLSVFLNPPASSLPPQQPASPDAPGL
jgi:hypothetical protein